MTYQLHLEHQPISRDIKEKYGLAMTSIASTNEIIEIPLVDGQRSKKNYYAALAQVIEPRMEELFENVQNEIIEVRRMGCTIASGIVITGGSSMLNGMR